MSCYLEENKCAHQLSAHLQHEKIQLAPSLVKTAHVSSSLLKSRSPFICPQHFSQSFFINPASTFPRLFQFSFLCY